MDTSTSTVINEIKITLNSMDSDIRHIRGEMTEFKHALFGEHFNNGLMSEINNVLILKQEMHDKMRYLQNELKEHKSTHWKIVAITISLFSLLMGGLHLLARII